MVTYIQNILLRGSLLEVLIAVAFAGAVASLSSCTIARLPVLLGLVSSNAASKHRGFFLSIAFSCGLIISYTFIGMLFGAIAHIASRLVAISQYLYLVLGILMILGGLFFAGLISFGTGGINTHCEKAVKVLKPCLRHLYSGCFLLFWRCRPAPAVGRYCCSSPV